MASEKLEYLAQAGFDTQGALGRMMGNEAFFLKMLGKFAQDQTYARLNDAMTAGNMEEVKNMAHALKGITSNLGMDALCQACATMQYVLEGREEGDPQGIFARIQETYQAAMDAVAKCL